MIVMVQICKYICNVLVLRPCYDVHPRPCRSVSSGSSDVQTLCLYSSALGAEVGVVILSVLSLERASQEEQNNQKKSSL